MDERIYQGQIYRRNGPNEPWTRIGPAPDAAPSTPDTPQTTVLAGPRPTDPNDAAREAATLEGLRLLNDQRRQALAEGNGREGATAADNAADARRANLMALVDQINSVQSLFEHGPGATTGVGALADYFPTSENQAFDAAGAGLVDQAMAAFRVPGVGAQSDADAARLAAAYSINASDRDAVIEQRLGQLRQRVETNMRELGMGEPQWNGANLPRAAGVEPNAIAPDGVTGGDGTRESPELRGLGNEVAQLIGMGRTREEVMAHIRERFTASSAQGLDPNIHAGFVDQVIAAHRANPSRPVRSLGTGWERMDRVPVEGGGWRGWAADSAPGAFVINAANAVSAGNLGNVAGDDARLTMQLQRNDRPIASLAGDVAGTVGALAGVQSLGARLGTNALARGGGVVGDVLYGGVRGASETEGDIGDRALGALGGAGAAGVGNLAGRGIVGGLGRVTRGVSDPAVRYLAERGIRLTPGQALGRSGGMFGRAVRGAENAMESVPFVGAGIAQRRLDSLADYSRAQIAENLQPLGVVPTGATVQDMLASARNAVSDQYRALDGQTFTPMTDSQFVTEAGAALRSGAGLNRTGEDFTSYFRNRIDPAFDSAGNLPGRNFQDVLQGVDAGQAAFQQDGALGSLASDALGDFGDALRGAASRQNPQAAEALRLADLGHANVVPLENAAITAATRGGEFTPANYLRSATTNTRRFGGRSRAAQGNIPGAELAQAANDVLPSIVPNSGTTDRALASLALPAALGGASYGANELGFGNTATGLGGLAALSSIYTPSGRAALQALLVQRPDAARRLGETLIRQRRRGGLFGASIGGASVPLLTGQ